MTKQRAFFSSRSAGSDDRLQNARAQNEPEEEEEDDKKDGRLEHSDDSSDSSDSDSDSDDDAAVEALDDDDEEGQALEEDSGSVTDDEAAVEVSDAADAKATASKDLRDKNMDEWTEEDVIRRLREVAREEKEEDIRLLAAEFKTKNEKKMFKQVTENPVPEEYEFYEAPPTWEDVSAYRPLTMQEEIERQMTVWVIEMQAALDEIGFDPAVDIVADDDDNWTTRTCVRAHVGSGKPMPGDEKIVMETRVEKLGLTASELLRLEALAGPRFKKDKGMLKLTSSKYPTAWQNKKYLDGVLKDLLAEAKNVDEQQLEIERKYALLAQKKVRTAQSLLDRFPVPS